MAKNQKKAGKEKKAEKKAEANPFQMVKTKDIKDHYPWKVGPDEEISRKMGSLLYISTKDDVKKVGIQEALHLVYLDAAPDHIENKENFTPGYYTLCGRNRWDIAQELGIKEVKAEIVEAGPYKKMVAYGIRSNLFRKSAKEKAEAKVDSTDPKKDTKKEAIKVEDISTALLRGTWIEVEMEYDPEASEKLRAKKAAYTITKDPEKKAQLGDQVEQLKASGIALKTCGESIGIGEYMAIVDYWFRQAIKEDYKAGDEFHPRKGGYDYNSWRDMAEAKGVEATYDAYMIVRAGKQKPDPDYKPLIIKVQDKELGFMANTYGEFQEGIQKGIEENPGCIIIVELNAKLYTEPDKIPDNIEGGFEDEKFIPAIIGSQDEAVEKMKVIVGELKDQIAAKDEELENTTDSRNAEHDKVEHLEEKLEEAQNKLGGDQGEELQRQLEMSKGREKETQERLNKKIAEIEEIKNNAIAELTELQAGKRASDNPYFEHRFTSVDIDQMYAWQKQQLQSAMEAQGGPVGAVKVSIEFEPKAVKK